MQNQFFLHQYWKFMHFSPYMPLARRPSLFSIAFIKYVPFRQRSQTFPLFQNSLL